FPWSSAHPIPRPRCLPCSNEPARTSGNGGLNRRCGPKRPGGARRSRERRHGRGKRVTSAMITYRPTVLTPTGRLAPGVLAELVGIIATPGDDAKGLIVDPEATIVPP